jgi:hypothetical protein
MKMTLFALITVFVGFQSAAEADDMDFGSIEVEQVKKGVPSLDEVLPKVDSVGGGSTSGNGISTGPKKEPEKEPEMATATGALVGTTTVSSRKSKWSEIKRNFGAGFFQYANIAANEVNRSKGSLDTYNYMSLEYRTGRGEKIFVRPAFLYNTGGEDLRGKSQESKFSWSDLYFGYSSYSIPWLPFNMDYKTEIRVYLPTSDSSQNEGMIARLRGDLKAHYPLTSRLTFLLWFKPDYFIQRRTAKLSTNGRFANGTRNYGYELSANLFYQFRGAVWGLGGAVGHEQSWANDSVVEQVSVFRREDVSAQAFVGINAFGFLTHIGIDQTRNVSRPSTPLVALNDSETQYFARTYYRF